MNQPQTPNTYACWECRSEFKRSAKGEFFCKVCMPKYVKGEIDIKLNISAVTDSSTSGYAGYNHGLDAVVENRGHWKRLVKEQGLTNVG